MMITEEMIAEDEKRWNDRNIVAELGYCGKNICHRKNITNDDIRFYAYIMRQAHALLKEQEARVMAVEELAFYDSGLYVETHNGCPEGLTDELWPALVHLYCVSQNGKYGYVSFVNWNADTYDFEAKDYNVDFRCWTSRPTDEQREAVKWDA